MKDKDKGFNFEKFEAMRTLKDVGSVRKLLAELQKYEPKASMALICGWKNLRREPSRKYLFALSKILKCDVMDFFS